MTYIPRLEVPYGYYHVVTRGNNKQLIYADELDRERFLVLLSRVARRYGWLFSAYCLMGNHYHLVMQIADAGLSRGMCELNTGHAITFNLRHGRANHLFGRRFWSELITTDAYLLEACRYVVQNPVRAGLCATCDDWEWSSYRATVGAAAPEPFLAVKSVLDFFGPRSPDPVGRFRHYCGTVVPKRQRHSGRVVAATVTTV
ncbi:MAG: transposase [Gaiellaceae bacterium]|jgi:putative transposase